MSRRDNHMSCARVQVLVEPYLDGELSASHQQSVAVHLRHCVDCSAVCEAARAIQVSLRDMPEFEFPVALRDQLLDRIARSTQVRAPAWQQRLAAAVARSWDFMTGRNAGANGWLRPAATLAVVTLVVYLWAQQRQPEQTTLAQGVSTQELQEAGEQARWALTYLARVTVMAGDTAFYRVGSVMGDAVGEHVFGSITHAVGRPMEKTPAAEMPGELEEEVQIP